MQLLFEQNAFSALDIPIETQENLLLQIIYCMWGWGGIVLV